MEQLSKAVDGFRTFGGSLGCSEGALDVGQKVVGVFDA
jgi:hypothetical protein